MTIYFRNLENITISGKEGQEIKKTITRAIEEGCKQEWIIIRHEGEEVPTMIVNLNDIITVR
jgi:lysylphosphatidylglycerol synthetase-like protein (DUF2156 family)